MRLLSRCPALVAAALAALSLGAPSTQAAPAPAAIAEQYIVVFKPAVADAKAATHALAQQHGLSPSHVYQHALKGFAARVPSARVAALRADSRVLFIAQDRQVHSTVLAPGPLSALVAGPPQQAPTGLQRIGAAADGVHQTLTNQGAGIGVAVIDTGIALNHPDLQANIAPTSTSTGRRK